MIRMLHRNILSVLSSCLLVFACCAPADNPGDWLVYAADKASSRYSALDQINAENFSELEVAWRWETVDQPVLDADTTLWTGQNESTPLAVDGILYTSTSLSQVAAIDGATGETIWTYDPGTYRNGSPPNLGFIHRGVAYWESADVKRIVYGTGDAYLIALDAATGELIADFGDDGRIDLTQGLRRPVNRLYYGVSSPPIVCRDKVVVGASIFDAAVEKAMPPGDVRAFDMSTGELHWLFESIPQGELAGGQSWDNLSWRTTGNTNVWSFMSCDEELGYVYLPFTTPSNDYYGGERPGDNLYAETIVAVDVETGDLVWHFQGVHHGIWDYDFPAAPNLVDITVDGREIKALAQVSKQAFTYVLDRETGEPVWPIEERPVPQEPTVPGEQLSRTQPFPTKPAAFDLQGIGPDDLIDFTPALRAEAETILEQYGHGPLFTPFTERGGIAMPGVIGGASWAGAAVDPESGVLYVPSITFPFVLTLAKLPDEAPYRYHGDPLAPAFGPQGLFLTKPPYGRVTAIDLNTGEHVWMRAMGRGPRDHPALADLDLPELGWPFRTFVLRTASLLLATQEGLLVPRGMSPRANAVELTTQNLEPSLRALDPATGEIIAEIPIPGNVSGAPITYLANGQQYIAIPIGGASQKAELIALRLPEID